MKLFGFFVSALFLNLTLFAQSIHHKLSMPEPQSHYFHVQVEVSDVPGEELIMVLPVWAPGSYLVREFSQNINVVKAKDENGESVAN